VLRHPIAPKIFAHESAHVVVFGDAPRQGRGEMSDLPEFPHAELLRPEKGLVHADRKPGMLLDERATDADRVHDGKNAGLAKVARLGSRVIGEQAADMRRTRQETGRRAGADHAIELAGRQHVRQRAVFGNGLVVDIRRSLMRARSSRPGCSSPPRRQLMSLGLTPYSSVRIPRTQTLAVIWYSGTPRVRPLRSAGRGVPRSVAG